MRQLFEVFKILYVLLISDRETSNIYFIVCNRPVKKYLALRQDYYECHIIRAKFISFGGCVKSLYCFMTLYASLISRYFCTYAFFLEYNPAGN